MANLMAPVAYVENMVSPIRLIAPFVDEIEVSSQYTLSYWYLLILI
jgi:hypothetical protein